MNLLKRLSLVFGVSAFAVLSAHANPLTSGQIVTVQEIAVSPNQIVTITSPINGVSTTVSVYAGVTKLLVDGVAYDSFCIDPFQYSSSGNQPYVVAELAAAPLPYFTMGAAEANTVAKLWALNYSPTMNASNAALLQIAIWEVIGGGHGFSVAGAWASSAQTLVNQATGSAVAPANLLALTNGAYQDYVVQNVPDGGATIALLGFGLLMLASARKWQVVRVRN
jgi:hypothetical protein